ncbi:phage gp6-like head-tail connector protein [Listeria monocytogenes]|nr:phage gp6-like head-tail connector protein [Listeria monocytogenes]EAF3882243.1 phage gp6-like head-tail connector protein [Listeria monocytogenes]EKZ0859787.1 phage gp6-like head-tail connector protein [Listeria monocytogenes]
MLNSGKKEDVSRIKNHVRVDHDFDDESLQQLLEAAQITLQGMIGSDANFAAFYDVEENEKLFDIATLFLVDHWYKTRSATTSLTFSEAPLSVKTIVLLLKPNYLSYKRQNEV